MFLPAPPDAGIVFVRTDLGPQARLPAAVAFVTGTQRRTTLGLGPVTVSLVEHVLAALAGSLHNCTLEVNAPEPPGLDGSAEAFVAVLQRAGVTLQSARRAIWTVDRPLIVSQQGATLGFHPADDHTLHELFAGLRLLDALASPVAHAPGDCRKISSTNSPPAVPSCWNARRTTSGGRVSANIRK